MEELGRGDSLEKLYSLLGIDWKGKNKQKKFAHYYFKKDSKYNEFKIPKKNGGVRKINAPDKTLKEIQEKIKLFIEEKFTPLPAANGFVKERSIISNAKNHQNKKYIFNSDLKDFFPSITWRRVKAVLKNPPISANEKMAAMIANFATYQGVLPQGSPCSPIITNLVCQRLDWKLAKLAKKNQCWYTRYADDITFSSWTNVFSQEFIDSYKSILKEEGFSLNQKKTRILKSTGRQEVTGIIVNKKLNVRRKLIKEVRAILHNWERDGLRKTEERFSKYYSSKQLYNVVQGKINFIGSIRGKDDKYYTTFRDQLNRLKSE